MANASNATLPQSGRSPRSLEVESPRGKLLQLVVELVDATRIPYCILHGYEGHPARVVSDVDCIMPAEFLPGPLATVLRANRERLGARVVQWIQHESTAHYFVLATDGAGPGWEFLAVDVSSDYRRDGRVFYSGEEILASRRSVRGFWVPSPALEFGCYLVKKVAKAHLRDDHGLRLTQLYHQDPTGCDQQIGRFWGGPSARLIGSAAASGEWSAVQRFLTSLRRELVWPATVRQWWFSGRYWMGDVRRRFRRWRAPTGAHVVLLGPDGSGKSTIISCLTAALAPAFRRVSSQHLAPALVRGVGATCRVTLPHSRHPRSLIGSLAKAAYWFLDYTLGYYAKIRPALARSTLVLFDRYLVDALVDPRRYRYGGPRWVLRLIWSLVPKPDLVILLDAPAVVLRARKQEVSLVETQRQRDDYRQLAETLPNAHVVGAAQPVDRVVAAAGTILLDFLTSRTAHRLEVRDRAAATGRTTFTVASG